MVVVVVVDVDVDVVVDVVVVNNTMSTASKDATRP